MYAIYATDCGSGLWAAVDARKHRRTRCHEYRSFTTPKRETKPTQTVDSRHARRRDVIVTSSVTSSRSHTTGGMCCGEKNQNPSISNSKVTLKSRSYFLTNWYSNKPVGDWISASSPNFVAMATRVGPQHFAWFH